MRARIAGRSWTVEFGRVADLSSRAHWGECDPPTARHPRITIRRSLKPRAMLMVTVHELLHASFPHLSEAAVTESADEIARVLYRLGARVTPPES